MSLNDAQQIAVDYHSGHCLIVAGPGTGKTHTLIARMIRIATVLKPHEKILAITFTNKSADEMLNRLKAGSIRLDSVQVGTFHRFCLSLLRQYINDTPLPKDFKVALPNDIESLIEDKNTIERIGFAKSTQLVLEATPELLAYQKALRANGFIDFDDILREALMLLDTNEDILKEVSAQYPFIFVDEYQDTNPIQHELLRLLAFNGSTVTAIGDPNQAIYGFRGSDVELFHRFEDDFKGAQVFYLNENYRSGLNILNASSQVIAINSRRGVPQLTAKLYNDGKLTVHEATTDRAEAEFIAHQIEKIVGGLMMRRAQATHHSFGDIAILTRLNAQQQVIAQALEHLGIPYQIAKKITPPDNSDDNVLGQREEELDYTIEKVSLLTLHAAKGLEFPVVFMAGCEEKILPLDLVNLTSDINEERRLFYVGMTRAKEELFLTYAKRRQLFGQALMLSASPFLADIQEDLKAYEMARRKKAVKVDDQLKLF